mgnify:FL=1
MQQANELLYGILKTLGRIEENTRGSKPAAPAGPGAAVRDKIAMLSNLGPSLIGFGKVKPKTIKDFFSFIEQMMDIANKKKGGAKNLKDLSESLNNLGTGLPKLAEGLDSMGRVKEKQVTRTLSTLKMLMEFLEDKGDSASIRKVDRAIKTFEKIGNALTKIAKPVKDISLSFAYLGLGILAFAGSLLLTAMILKLSKPTDVIMFLGVTVLGLLVMFGTLALANRFIKKGVFTLVEMGLGLAALAFGLLSFAMAMSLIPKILSKESGGSILKSMLIVGGVILGAAAIFALVAPIGELILLGGLVILGMGATFWLLSLMIKKIVNVANELKDVPIRDVLGNLIGGVLGGMIDGISVLSGGKKGIGGIAEFIKNSAKIFAGIGVLMSMSLALCMFAIAVTAFAELENMRIIEGYDKDGKPIFGAKVNLTKVADNISYSISTFLTALLESTETLTKEKAVAIRKMGRALTGRRGILSAVIQFADAMKVYAEFGEANEIGYVDYDDKGNEIKKKVKATVVVDNMIGSFLYFTEKLFGRSESEFGDGEPEGKGISGKQKRRMKRMSKALIGRHGILSAVIQFADAMKVYAEFGENNEIGYVEYDDKGNEIRKKVKATTVVDNIIRTFLYFSEQLFSKSESEFGDGEEAGISGRQKRRMQKMSKALIGRHGILSAVIQFADAMKVYAEFGENNEIGYVEYDDKGNEIRKKVKATTVVDNIIRTFLYFSEQLFSKSESEFGDGEEAGISGRPQGNGYKRMQKMSKALIGRHGILGAVVQFSEVVRLFSEFGEKNELPVLDKDGKPTGETISMATISNNIVKALTTFSDTLATGLEKSTPKDAKKALEKYSDIIEELSKFSESLGNLQKANDTIGDLAKSLNDLSISLDNFDTDKLSKLASISVSAGGGAPSGTAATATTAERIQEKSKAVKESSAASPNWDVIASQIGETVGAQIAEAMKKGQIKFEFSPSSPGKGVLTFD